MTITAAAMNYPTLQEGDYQITGYLEDPASEPVITITNRQTGDVLEIDRAIAFVLARNGLTIYHQMDDLQHTAQFEANHPMVIAAEHVASRDTGWTPGNGYAATLIAANETAREGIPTLMWVSVPQNGEPRGWRLTIIGAETTTVGFAPWHDKDAILSLVAALPDADSALVMGGMVDPENLSRLTARANVADLRSSRAIPVTNLKDVTRIIKDNRLQTGQTGWYARSTGGRMRILSLPSSDGRDVPCAVAVKVPSDGGRFRQYPTDDELEGMPYQNQRALIEQRSHEAVELWIGEFTRLMVAAGYRQVDLPNPRHHYTMSGSTILWFTKMPSEAWSSVSAAAEVAAQNLQMQRGKLF